MTSSRRTLGGCCRDSKKGVEIDQAAATGQNPRQGVWKTAEAEPNRTTALTGPRKPATPAGAGPSGKRLWRSVVDSYELEVHELLLLKEAVRTVDLLDDLAKLVADDGPVTQDRFGQDRVHPALVEARQLKIALARLLAALRLPDGVEGDESQGRRTQRRVGARGVYGTAGRHLGSVS